MKTIKFLIIVITLNLSYSCNSETCRDDEFRLIALIQLRNYHADQEQHYKDKASSVLMFDSHKKGVSSTLVDFRKFILSMAYYDSANMAATDRVQTEIKIKKLREESKCL